MKKAFTFLALLLPCLGMAQSYCLTKFYSEDRLETVNYYYGNDNELVAYDYTDITDSSDPLYLRDTLTYDANGNCVRIDNYQLIDGIWKYTYYINYEYDNNHHRTARENYNSFNGGQSFDLGGRYEYTYNGDQLSGYVMYFVGSEFMRGQYTYNANGQVTELLETQNDPWGGTGWSNSSKTVWTYNAQGQCTFTTFYYWSYSWEENKRYEYEYDEAGNTKVRYTFENIGLTDRITYEFDLDTPYSELIMPNDPEGDYAWDTFTTRPIGYAWETADWEGNLNYICDFVYEYCTVSAVGEQISSLNMLQVYPNPTEGLTTIKLNGAEQVVVMDMEGRVVMRQNLNGNHNTVDLSSLSSGLYLLKAFDGQIWQVGKVQVK